MMKLRPFIAALSIALASIAQVGCTDKSQGLKPLDLGEFAQAPQTIGFTLNNYKPQPGNTFVNIFVSNFSVIALNNQLSYSTARDGMSDTLKQSLTTTFGFGITSPETVVTGFQDLVLYRLGINLAQTSSLVCAQTSAQANDIFSYTDTRNGGNAVIGLRDCDKLLMGLKSNTFDNNANGIPDYLEMRCGMNPKSKIQAFLSTGADGLTNLQKCQQNIPIAESALSPSNKLFAYQYATTVNADRTLNFNITNIPVLNGGLQNFIALYLVESNLTSQNSVLYSAYAIMPAGYVGRVLTIDYKTLSAGSPPINTQMVVPP